MNFTCDFCKLAGRGEVKATHWVYMEKKEYVGDFKFVRWPFCEEHAQNAEMDVLEVPNVDHIGTYLEPGTR